MHDNRFRRAGNTRWSGDDISGLNLVREHRFIPLVECWLGGESPLLHARIGAVPELGQVLSALDSVEYVLYGVARVGLKHDAAAEPLRPVFLAVECFTRTFDMV